MLPCISANSPSPDSMMTIMVAAMVVVAGRENLHINMGSKPQESIPHTY